MGKVVYREFMGSRLVLTILWLTGIGIPMAVVYFIENTVTVEEDVESPTAFVDVLRERHKAFLWGKAAD
jgi:hypothetical protein